MNDALTSIQNRPSATPRAEAAQRWLGAFEAALASRDAARVGALFEEDCHWRDILAFTWDFSSARGREEIATRLTERQTETQAGDFHLPAGRKPPREVRRVGRDCIEAIFAFTTAIGRCDGIVRLSLDSSGEPKAWHVSTVLEELIGHEETIGERRPTGAAYSRNFGGDNWLDARRRAMAYEDREPTVLVIGGAQAGLSIAARLNQLGVDTLVVESTKRIGDSWRNRYHSLALHNSIHLNHLPYMEFPPTFPKYLPKDLLGNWFEFYADAMEINCWTDTEFTAGEWDESTKSWTVRLKRGDGSERTVRPRHLVFANGVSSYPYIPDIPGLADFKGDVIHSEGFQSGAAWSGQRAFIIGTGSSANDIALDLHSFGVDTTIIQRGSTTVVSIDPSARLNESVWDEGPPLEDCDLIVASTTPALQIEGYKMVTKIMLELDKPMIEGLKGIGFKFDIGEDETGHQMKYFRRGGGYNLDAGSSELMIKGEIGLLHYETIDRFVAEGARLEDGSTVPADLIVLATGYYPQKELVRRALGDAMADRIGPVWGLDANGELSNMFRRTPQEGLWFMAGALPHCRINSKYLALQIKATEIGVLGPRGA
ncbi:MAG: NAD(P)/FAD-dependent oxidoreductase [Microvirga sp.]|nr:NAD(P)/FAD-dependent oxidoreductase [Microvirga sp.]